MVHLAFYLVRPKHVLRDRLSSMAGDVADLLLEPSLFTQGEADRASWNRDDYLAAVKLTYLASLAGDYGKTPEFTCLFPGEDIFLDGFDEFWEIERFYFPEDINSVLQQTDKKVLARLRKTGRPVVDAWLENATKGQKGEQPI